MKKDILRILNIKETEKTTSDIFKKNIIKFFKSFKSLFNSNNKTTNYFFIFI